MKEKDFRAFTEYYDQLYSQMKNYGKEAEIVSNVIRKFEHRKPKTLLDVGCGTGEHMKHFVSNFKCTGIDINKGMIRIAKGKVPEAKFQVADMTNFSLKNKFDVIISLFSAVGYVKSFNNLVKAFRNMRRHLNDEGLVIVEPWVFKEDFMKGHVSLDTIENEDLKFARMAASRIAGPKWTIVMHYLVGKEGKVNYFKETHTMFALSCSDYVEAFKRAGFRNTEYVTEGLWKRCRGLFVSTT
jgi:ubiquinone/menaquinone biosynthesis C-methylase UbiE